MLVLSRRDDQVIYIGEGAERITLTIVECRPGRVRLGIAAPEGVVILRGEVPSDQAAEVAAKAGAK